MDFHTHDGDHVTHERESKEKKALTVVLCMTVVFMFLEAIAGVFTGSLALLSDAAHMLTDVVAISLALFAIWFSLRPATSQKTFGFYRAEILAAFFNSLLLFGISAAILIEAYQRITNPNEVRSLEMTLVAFAGFCINLIGLYILFRAGSENLNIRGAVLHIASDLLGSVGAIAAGLIMLKTGWYTADPIISVLIALLILKGAWRLFSESVHILLEGTPRGIELKSLENAINSHEGVIEVHDLHAWTLTKGFEALSAHVVIEDIKSSESLVIEIRRHLRDKFQINHVTLQVETKRCNPEDMSCYEPRMPSSI